MTRLLRQQPQREPILARKRLAATALEDLSQRVREERIAKGKNGEDYTAAVMAAWPRLSPIAEAGQPIAWELVMAEVDRLAEVERLVRTAR